MAKYEKELKIAGLAPAWRCTVCGFVFYGENPLRGCPKHHSPSGEFIPEKNMCCSPGKGNHLTFSSSMPAPTGQEIRA